MAPVITPSELLSLQQHKNLVLIDARSGGDAKEKYLTEHLQGALWVDLEQDLAQKSDDPANGGRHPLPSPQQFNRLLAQLGIGPKSQVVVYDDKNGANAAARFWWMAKSIGQEQVQVLDGGLAAALAVGFPTRSGTETSAMVERGQADAWKWPTANIDEVEAAAQDAGNLVIDVREKDRYDGLREPIDLVAGHIPGAINVPFSDNLDETGRFLSPEALRSKYRAALGDRDAAHVVVHCGSGVTACHTLLALAHAGLEVPKLYVGSWSEWSRSGREIARKHE
ncbi:MAG: sulfurtransferase [Saprospiraceae bacterium]|nr:sulfurtransferase [Saprospiraceae bacterium]